MATILDDIIETKRHEVRLARARRSLDEVRADANSVEAPRDFAAAVVGASEEIRLIAEIKKASPSAGLIVADFDPARIARVYHEHAAAALSVLTDVSYFQGDLATIGAVKRVVPLPVLRKDFVIDAYQVYEARAADADAVLLIAEVLSANEIADLAGVCRQLGMTALVEVHDAANLDSVFSRLGLPSGDNYLLGINNRDLSAQHTDLTTTSQLAAHLPSNTRFISESGIATRDDVLAVKRAGACAVLVGEALLRATDIGAKIDSLMGR